jgi:hypothetical protein
MMLLLLLLLQQLQLLVCRSHQRSGPLHHALKVPHPHLWQQALAAPQRRFSRLLICSQGSRQGAVPHFNRVARCQGDSVCSTVNTPKVAAPLLSQLKGLQIAVELPHSLAALAFEHMHMRRPHGAAGVVGLQLAHRLGAPRCCRFYWRL